MVVNAPRIPPPTKIVISFEIKSLASAAIQIPSNREPTALTTSVACGVPTHSLITKRSKAPIAPPIATARYEFTKRSCCDHSINHAQKQLASATVMTIWFMTTNQGKVEEAKEYFSRHGLDVKQFEFEAIEPQADNLETVALSKIEQAIPHLPNPNDMLLVEDAGLFVDALDGFPGVYSSYVLRTLDIHGILKLMNHLKSEDPIQDGNLRKAEFRAVSVLYKNGQTIVSEGVCPGRIAHSPVTGDGFGFDPIFVPADLDEEGKALPVGEIGVKSTHGTPFGGIPLEEKQNYSHRHRALKGILSHLDSLG